MWEAVAPIRRTAFELAQLAGSRKPQSLPSDWAKAFLKRTSFHEKLAEHCCVHKEQLYCHGARVFRICQAM